MRLWFVGLFLVLRLLPAAAPPAPEPKEWTMILFLNGNNDLDKYGAVNINQMETVGSNKNFNLVVQWASLATKVTRRLLVQKDNDPEKVTSPFLEEFPRVDMGDWKVLVEFAGWAIERYPAKRYALILWDHGSGWHYHPLQPQPAVDISHDEPAKHKIRTEELGEATREIAKRIGHPIDLLALDACSMAMAEVSTEVADSVHTIIASQAPEPGLGWPYDKWLQRWNRVPDVSTPYIGKILAQEYIMLHEERPWRGPLTLSVTRADRLENLNRAIAKLSVEVQKLAPGDIPLFWKALEGLHSYGRSDLGDYADLKAMAQALTKMSPARISGEVLSEIVERVDEHVYHTSFFPLSYAASGVNIWLPRKLKVWQEYQRRYPLLKFEDATRWSKALRHLYGQSS